jgi:DNA-binding LacI/PurR family transcriptional regulator
MAVTSADVARRAGLSRATVSQVLNGYTHRFSPETAERVLTAAKELDYAPSAVARMLRSGSSDFVVALVPNTTFGGNLQDIFDSVTERLSESGLILVLRLSTQSGPALDLLLAGMRPRAVLALQPFSDAERKILEERGVPGFDPSLGGNLNYAIGRIQAEHLVSRGYRKLAFAHLHDNRADPYGADREDAVRDVCAAAGLPEPAVLRLGIDADQANEALGSIAPGYGIVCYNDDVAITLLGAIGRKGWTVPSDVGLIGMDHTPLSQATEPRLTTVGYDLQAVAQTIVATALGALGQGELPAELDINLHVVPGGSA